MAPEVDRGPQSMNRPEPFNEPSVLCSRGLADGAKYTPKDQRAFV
jgi:hypothetical protein